MVGQVDLDGKKVDAVVADWIAKNEDRWKKWIWSSGAEGPAVRRTTESRGAVRRRAPRPSVPR